MCRFAPSRAWKVRISMTCRLFFATAFEFRRTFFVSYHIEELLPATREPRADVRKEGSSFQDGLASLSLNRLKPPFRMISDASPDAVQPSIERLETAKQSHHIEKAKSCILICLSSAHTTVAHPESVYSWGQSAVLQGRCLTVQRLFQMYMLCFLDIVASALAIADAVRQCRDLRRCGCCGAA